MTPRIGSFCSGVGALDLAIEELTGGRVVWHAENDPHASAVLAAHWPGVPNHGDIKTFDWSTAEQIDVLCAGFPCQPFSSAGKRKAMADERWLWDDITRALRGMAALPGWIFLENVRGLLTAGGGLAMGHVLHDLAHLGFVGRYGLLPASAAGAPHPRERVFIVARRTDGPLSEPFDFGRERPVPEPRRHHCGSDAGPRYGPHQPAFDRWAGIIGRPAPWPPFVGPALNARLNEWLMGWPDGWATDLVPNSHALRLAGNGVVPQQALAAYQMLLADWP